MSADKYSHELSRSLTPYGIYHKIADRGYKVKGHPELGIGHSDLEPGFPDAFFITMNGGCMIEAKTAETAFAFSDWRENQRDFYKNVMVPRGIALYLFLVIGRTIRDKDYPRLAFMIRADLILELEAATKSRLSIPYKVLAGDDAYIWQLQWLTGGKWGFGSQNLFYQDLLAGVEPCLAPSVT